MTGVAAASFSQHSPDDDQPVWAGRERAKRQGPGRERAKTQSPPHGAGRAVLGRSVDGVHRPVARNMQVSRGWGSLLPG